MENMCIYILNIIGIWDGQLIEMLGSMITFAKETKKSGNDGSCTGVTGQKSGNMEIAIKVDGDVDRNQ